MLAWKGICAPWNAVEGICAPWNVGMFGINKLTAGRLTQWFYFYPVENLRYIKIINFFEHPSETTYVKGKGAYT